MKKCNLYKEDIKEIIRLVIMGSLGLGLSILFIALYQLYNIKAVTITTGIVSLLYMVICIIIIGKKIFLPKNSVIATIVIPLIYTAIIFAVLLLIERKRIPDNPMRVLDCFLWAVYTMPAFIVVIAIIVIIVLAIGYVGS